MTTLTCDQALSIVAEPPARELTPDRASDLSDHFLACDDCRTAVMGCGDAESLFEEALAGRLAPDVAGPLAGHLVGCDGCAAHAEAMLRAFTVLGDVPSPSTLAVRLGDLARERVAVQLRARAVETPLGWNGVAYSDNGLVLITRSQRGPADAIDRMRERIEDFVVQERPRDDVGLQAIHDLSEYYEGRLVRFGEPLDLSLATPFTRDVLDATSRIPYGEVRPYAWVAREIRKPRAFRAVGQALHVNPLAPIIPCHRVVASGGALGGYGGGPEMKRWLLRLEGYLPEDATKGV